MDNEFIIVKNFHHKNLHRSYVWNKDCSLVWKDKITNWWKLYDEIPVPIFFDSLYCNMAAHAIGVIKSLYLNNLPGNQDEIASFDHLFLSCSFITWNMKTLIKSHYRALHCDWHHQWPGISFKWTFVISANCQKMIGC